MNKKLIIAIIAGIIPIVAGSPSMPGRGEVLPLQIPSLHSPAAGNPSALTIDFGKIPLYFTANRGQVDGRALYYAKAAHYTLWLTEEGLIFDSFRSHGPAAPGAREESLRTEDRDRRAQETERDVSRLVFLNASKHPEIVAQEETPLKVNYFTGGDPADWHAAVPTFGAILYKDVYDRIDLRIYGIESRIEYDWIVRPGGDPRDIAFEYTDVNGTRIDPTGNLVIETGFGELLHQKPVAYQESATRTAVSSAFKPLDANAYGFDVGSYDAGRTLVVDPVVLAYSTYLGGSGAEKAYDIAADGSGRAYVTGYTDSGNFPTLGSYQTDLGLRDVFVSMLDTTQAGATSLVYSTYLGGSGTDVGTGIALDANGYVYVSGHTNSTDFPAFHPYQTDQAGADAFVAKLDPAQTGPGSLLFSTYLGGNGSDYGWGIAADASGCAYVTGDQDSTDFPTLNPYQTDQAQTDLFVTKLDTTKSGAACLLYSTYLGGSSSDFGYGIATDGIGGAYVTGYTVSSDFPILNPYQTDQGVRDVFVTRLDTTKAGTASLIYSTFLGGSNDDYGMRIAAVGNGLAFVAGFTDSTDFPVVNPFQTDPGDGKTDAFIAKIDTSQSGAPSLAYSTYIGGSGADYGYAVSVDSAGVVTVTGETGSTNYPTSNAYQTDPGGGASDAFVTRIDPAQSGAASLIYSTYLGGSAADEGAGIAMDSSGNVYVTGFTDSSGFPTLNSYQTDQSGTDGFVTKIYDNGLSESLTVTAPNGGESWEAGSSHFITWTTTGTVGNVRIEYSTDSGGSWTDVAASTANDGTHSWTVPGSTSTQGLVRISQAAGGLPSDVSNAAFSIVAMATITVTSPNGAESWEVGSAHNITWTTTGTVADVRIEHSSDSGGTWTDVAATTPNDGTHAWTVPNSISTQCLVRISRVIGGTPSDVSDAVFSIAAVPAIMVTSPNGGESWQVGSAHDITWTSAGAVGNVRIEYSTNNGGAWTDVTASTANDGLHSWTIPNTVSTQCLVRISQATGGIPSDVSDAVFSIVAVPTITVTSPNGGESWDGGSAHDITWTTTGTVADVRIEYSTDNGGAWTDVAASTANDGTHSWTLPMTTSTLCLVRIGQAAGGAPSDVSDAAFSIVAVQTLTVTSPNGGESWEMGSAHNITWTTTGTVADVRIEYSTDNGGAWTDVAASTANDGTHSWTLPMTTSTLCLVRISQAAGGTPTDVSNAVFSIVPHPAIGLNRTALTFGAASGGPQTQNQNVTISNSGGGTLNWTATPSTAWISATPGSGTGTGTVAIGIDATGLAPGAYSGTVVFSDPNATNSPRSVTVNLNVYDGAGTQPPFGDFATPLNGTANVIGAIPVTGWVLDDIGISSLDIKRDQDPSDPPEVVGPDGLVYIGSGLFVEGLRPDVESGYSDLPLNYAAGWGYMLLTNFLPNHGNGTFTLHAIATDKEGHVFSLGTRTITCNNANAQKPFGTIDTPGQGGTSSGTFFSFGWVLTPLTATVPKDGHTITVYVDSVLRGNLSTSPNVYNQYRSDVSNNFPGLNNTGGPGGLGGPVGAWSFNTTGYDNAVHSIFWIAYDDQGRGEGIGSRFFNILNVGSAPEPAPAAEAQAEQTAPASDLSMLPLSFKPVRVLTGFDLNAEFQPRLPDTDGILRIEIPEVNRLEIEFGGDEPEAAALKPGRARISGFMLVGDELRPLPVGSTLDRRTGRFSWMPGPGFVGTYDLVFLRHDGTGGASRIPIKITIAPK